MSTLETNSIGKYSGNNVAVDDSLNLKSYSTSARNALTSAAGDMIYNTDDNKVQFYNGSAWADTGLSTFNITAVTVGGGGCGGGGVGGSHFGAGAASGVLESSTQQNVTTFSYLVTVGAGGATAGSTGSSSIYNTSTSIATGGNGTTTGRVGGSNDDFSGVNYTVGLDSGGGAGAGANASTKNGGNGAVNTILTTTQASTYSVGEVSGSDVYYGGGGGGGNTGTGGLGGGGDGTGSSSGSPGTVNTGGGGGGGPSNMGNNSNGGSGVVILKYPSTRNIDATRTGLTDSGEFNSGSFNYIVFTAGTGTVSFS